MSKGRSSSNSKRQMNPVVRFQTFPPCLVRLLARRAGKALTDEQISRTGGLPVHLVDSFSWRTDWDSIPVTQALAFLAGCGLGLADTQAWRGAESYLRMRPTFRYLRASPEWESFYQPLLVHWRKSCGQVDDRSTVWPPLRALLLRLTPLLDRQS